MLTLLLMMAFAEPSIPDWLWPYPGSVQRASDASAKWKEQSYEAAQAKSADIVEHYRKIFDSRKIPFAPNSDGIGISIRTAAAPDCDLLLKIRDTDSGAAVRLTCSVKPDPSSAPATPPATRTAQPPRSRDPQTEPMLRDADEQHKRRINAMKVYDTPVRPPRSKGK